MFTLLLLEASLRFLFPVPEVVNFNRVEYSNIFGGSEGLHRKRFLSNTSYSWHSEPDGKSYVHSLNLYGFRDRQWSMRKSRPRFMFVGDSCVEGFMAIDDETIPSFFAKEAAKYRCDVEVIRDNSAGKQRKVCSSGQPHDMVKEINRYRG